VTNPFPTSVSVDQLFGPKFKPDPPKPDHSLLIAVFVGFFLALGLSVVINANVFFPAWGVFSFVGWAILSSRKEEK